LGAHPSNRKSTTYLDKKVGQELGAAGRLISRCLEKVSGKQTED
jgi:hypothetical protein